MREKLYREGVLEGVLKRCVSERDTLSRGCVRRCVDKVC